MTSHGSSAGRSCPAGHGPRCEQHPLGLEDVVGGVQNPAAGKEPAGKLWDPGLLRSVQGKVCSFIHLFYIYGRPHREVTNSIDTYTEEEHAKQREQQVQRGWHLAGSRSRQNRVTGAEWARLGGST